MILLIGASGFIGRHIYRLCRQNSIAVTGTSTGDRDAEGFIKFRMGEDNPCDLSGVFDGSGYNNAVIIAGAITSLDECCRDEKKSNLVNVYGTKQIIDFFNDRGIKTVFLSSDCVFDGKSGGYTENSPTSPLCVYGRQKAEIEKYILSNGADNLVFRLSKQYDTAADNRHLLSDLYQSAMSGKVRCIDGLKFNPTYVEDTARCILKGIEKNLSGVYNLAAPESYTRYDIADFFVKELGTGKVVITNEPLENFNFNEERALDMSMDTGKIQAALGHEFCDIKSGIKKFVSNLNQAGR